MLLSCYITKDNPMPNRTSTPALHTALTAAGIYSLYFCFSLDLSADTKLRVETATASFLVESGYHNCKLQWLTDYSLRIDLTSELKTIELLRRQIQQAACSITTLTATATMPAAIADTVLQFDFNHELKLTERCAVEAAIGSHFNKYNFSFTWLSTDLLHIVSETAVELPFDVLRRSVQKIVGSTKITSL